MALLELQVDEIFDIDEGLVAIRREIEKNKSIELINIPLKLIRQWHPQLAGKQVTIYNNLIDGLPEDLRGLGREIFTAVEMKGTFYGEVIEKGEIFVKNRIFNVWYQDDTIHNIGSITYRRCVKCIQAMHRDILLKDEMPVLNIMTLYDAEQGMQAIFDAVERSSRVRMVNLPKVLVRKIVTYLETDDVKILCAQMSPQARQVSNEHHARVSGGLLNVYSRFKGKKIKSGGIALDDSFFNVDYLEEEIYMIRSIVWPRCPACMSNFYELGWRASRRIR
jgi:hypothetical protein